MLIRSAFLTVLILLAAACAPTPPDVTTPSSTRAALPSAATASEAGDTLEVPGYGSLLISDATVDLDAIVFDTFKGGSITLDRMTASMIARLADAIPPLESPRYDGVEGGRWLEPDDLVLGYVAADGTAYAYPHKILNYHEIVNDELGGRPVLVTYSPLSRSGVVYDRRVGRRTLSFGNTSARYLSDLVMFDRETYSYWRQVPGSSIVGALAGERLTPLVSETMEWRTWRALHPETMVLSRDTGFTRDYERDPFVRLGPSLDDGARPFQSAPVETDARLAPSDVVLGIAVDGSQAVYSLSSIGDGVRSATLGGRPVVVFGSAGGPSGAAYFADPAFDDEVLEALPEELLDEDGAFGDALTFEYGLGVWRDDQTGSIWNLAGRAIEGPLFGTQLEAVPSRTTFWYAFAAAFPDAELYR